MLQFDEENVTKNLPEGIDFKNKVVFVGFSGATQPEQDIVRDDYHTVFSNPNGLFISGVEIAATAFANLLENKPENIIMRKGDEIHILDVARLTELRCM